MPIFMAAKPVRNNRDSASLQPFGFLDRLPEFEAILVPLPHRTGGRLGFTA
jgi:hypothetical protein